MTAPAHLVVMGVSGTGKSTVGRLLAERLGWEFLEGDELHPPANVAKMSAGSPLDDDDRRPWLRALADRLADRQGAGRPTVLTCSALRRRYRDVLRSGLPPQARLWFVHLHAPAETLRERMESREHFMPPSLLQSQLDTLEPLQGDEHGRTYDVRDPADDVVRAVLADLARTEAANGAANSTAAGAGDEAGDEALEAVDPEVAQSRSVPGRD